MLFRTLGRKVGTFVFGTYFGTLFIRTNFFSVFLIYWFVVVVIVVIVGVVVVVVVGVVVGGGGDETTDMWWLWCIMFIVV